ncbi:replicative DNA helicase [Arcanobacterium wilhelmae]|uniref:Replicative DNA helicase n=1 Tax=Arcanobacterium wilhelmae TaxID=1803177 RepID=A0ABT9NAX2_9ACTO|nr:replicative DNA helicase [Arcanobacterium wilhelmae]MDP9800870.1 replicative DNA helicase [Arcanobacterium wilhelmae]WFN90238.1 replicative DNA helicase [Arcanobacterium wilhelmae]
MSEVVANSSFERTPPQNLEAEMSVLGGMMLSKDAIAEVVEVLRANDFYRPAHATIFEVVMDLFSRGEPADAVLVGGELDRRGKLEQIGGRAYLHTLVAGVPTAANTTYYAQIVREQAQLRSLVEVGTRIAQLGYSTEGGDVAELLNKAQSEMFAMTSSRVSQDYAAIGEVVPGLIEEIEANAARNGGLAGLSTGFTDLDNVLSGLRSSQMIIVAARPGMGKSTLAMDFCRHAAIRENKPVAFFSLEMNRNELMMRVLAAEGSLFLRDLIRGNVDQKGWETIAQTIERIGDAPMFVDDSPNLTMSEIRAKARRLRQQEGIELMVIDYLQLLTSGGRSPESRQQEVSEFSRSIKLLAKELEIPIIAISQLNRDAEKRNDRRPQVSDLRESGSLEQDADVVILINRPDAEEAGMEAPPAEVIIGKHRSGPTGSVELAFQGHFARFSNFGGMDIGGE